LAELNEGLNVNQTIGVKNLQSGYYEARVTVGGVNYTASVPSGELLVTITQGGIQINTDWTSTLLIELNIKVEGSRVTGVFRIVPAVRATPV